MELLADEHLLFEFREVILWIILLKVLFQTPNLWLGHSYLVQVVLGDKFNLGHGHHLK